MFIKELYEKYCDEFKSRLGGEALTFEQFKSTFGERLGTMDRVEISDPDGQGVLYYFLSDEGDRQVCVVPSCGYYASSGKVLTKLFTQLSDTLVSRKSTRFEMHLYARDTDAQRLFSMMQFGYMAETGIAKIDAACPRRGSGYAIKTLTKDEISAKWDEIWSMTSSVIRHLQQAPVFYPCEEFTEGVYREFFTDEATHLHAAFGDDGRMIGMIETNGEENAVIGVRSANIGEVYVPEELRGTGLSDALFRYASEYERARGVSYLWVEHGTANPNARGFWGRYFESFEYEMDRTAEKF